MKIELNTHFTQTEREIIVPEWDGSNNWRSADGKTKIEVYAEVDSEALAPDIEGTPIRIIFVDIMYFVETQQDDEICWYMCCSQSKDDETLIPVGRYKTLNEISAAL